MSRRTERVSELLREEICALLLRGTKDPRLAHMVTITAVEVAADFKHAKVFVSVLGTEAEKAEVMQGFESAARFLRRELSDRLRLRTTPQLSFCMDDSIERGSRILQILKEIGPEA